MFFVRFWTLQRLWIIAILVSCFLRCCFGFGMRKQRDLPVVGSLFWSRFRCALILLVYLLKLESRKRNSYPQNDNKFDSETKAKVKQSKPKQKNYGNNIAVAAEQLLAATQKARKKPHTKEKRKFRLSFVGKIATLSAGLASVCRFVTRLSANLLSQVSCLFLSNCRTRIDTGIVSANALSAFECLQQFAFESVFKFARLAISMLVIQFSIQTPKIRANKEPLVCQSNNKQVAVPSTGNC